MENNEYLKPPARSVSLKGSPFFLGNDKPGQPGRYFEDQPKHRFINGLTPRIGDLQTTYDPWKKKQFPIHIPST